VEALVAKGTSQKVFNARHRGVVFYGKVENRVQDAHRSAKEWSSCCDEFVMPKGEDAKYPFTQEEYLVHLSEARFGLCLAGYGRKCHREVECMSMGCVPIVAGEVDITSYASPPVEGIHYLRVTEPEQVREKVKTISEEDWTRMSAACRKWWADNASCKGMFELTKRLVGA
jgi:hypothetical protein